MSELTTNLSQDSEKVIDFSRYWNVCKRRWPLIAGIFSATVGTTMLVTFLLKPVYQADAEVINQGPNQLSALLGLAQQLGALGGSGGTSNPLKTQAEIIRSRPVVQEVITSLNLQDNDGESLKYDDFLDNLETEEVRGTDVLSVSYRSKDPQEAVAVVKKLMSLYLKNNLAFTRSQAASARQVLERQIPKTELEIKEAAADMRRFQETNNVVDLSAEAEAGIKVRIELGGQILANRSKSTAALSQIASLQKQLGLNAEQAIAFSTLSQAPAVQQAFTDLSQIESQLAVERVRYRAPHPKITAIEKKRNSIKELLEQRIGQILQQPMFVSEGDLQMGNLRIDLATGLVRALNESQALIGQQALLNRSYQELETRLADIPRLAQQQMQLKQRLTIAQGTLVDLTKNFVTAKVAEDVNDGSVQLLSPATLQDEPVFPRPLLNLALGILAGTLFSGIAIFYLDQRDTLARSERDIRKFFAYPVLATIPKFTHAVDTHCSSQDQVAFSLPVRDQPYSLASTAYQLLKANLVALNSAHLARVIVVASTEDGEGKSTVAANLAAVMSSLDRKVLLIDADLRQPSQQNIWGLSAPVGLSNLLMDGVERSQTIAHVMPGLEVMSSGPPPANPIPLIDSMQMKKLLSQVSTDYDCVVIDTPALSVTPDALILTQQANGHLLLVAQPGSLNIERAKAVQSVLQQSNTSVLGLVMNGVDGKHLWYGDSEDGPDAKALPEVQVASLALTNKSLP
jgi:polysaccharide biosynthesis transport protein